MSLGGRVRQLTSSNGSTFSARKSASLLATLWDVNALTDTSQRVRVEARRL